MSREVVAVPPAEARAMVDTRDAQPDPRASSAAVKSHDAGRVDAAAGCEFVDDRIHLLE